MITLDTEFLSAEQTSFLQEYALTGNVQRALNVARVSRATLRKWKEDEEFSTVLDDAYEASIESAEEELRRRAMGWDEPVMHRGEPVYKRDPETGEILIDDNGRPVQFTTTKYSDKLLEVYMKANSPKYKDKAAVELTGKDGGPIDNQIIVNYVLPSGKKVEDYE